MYKSASHCYREPQLKNIAYKILKRNHNLIKNVEDTVFFLTGKVFISVSFSIASYKQEMRKSLLQRNRNDNKQFRETRTLIFDS